MKTAAMVLGIIGGIFALLIGLAGYTCGSILANIKVGQGPIIMILSLTIPVMALWGTSVVKQNSKLGGILMLLSAIIAFIAFGVNILSLLPGIPLTIGGILGLTAVDENKNSRTKHSNPNIIESEQNISNIQQNKDIESRNFSSNQNNTSIIESERNITKIQQNNESINNQNLPQNKIEENYYSAPSGKQYSRPLKDNISQNQISSTTHYSKYDSPAGETSTKTLKVIAYILFFLAIGVPVCIFIYAAIDSKLNKYSSSITISPLLILAYAIPLLFFSILLFVFSAISKNLIEMRFVLQSKFARYFAGDIDEYLRKIIYSLEEKEKIEQKFELLLEKLELISNSNFNSDIKNYNDVNTYQNKPSTNAQLTGNQEMNIQEVIERANILFKANDFSGALENYNKAISVNNNNFVLYSKRANTYFSLKDLENAIRDYDRAIALKPDYTMNYYYRGYAKLNKEDMPGAKQDLQKALNSGIKQAGELLEKYFK